MAKKEKVTVIVLEEFQDKFDHQTLYPVGTELEVDKERADDLVGRKLANIKEVKAPKELKESENSKEVMTETAKAETAKTEAEKPEEREKDDDKGTEK